MNINNNSNNNQSISQNPQSSEQKPKRQRRSKHEPEGRSFTCEQCSKSYLSKAALTNHFQQKHNDILRERNIPKKGRGRPRRYIIDNQENDQEKEKFEKFFEKANRAKIQQDLQRTPEQNYEKAFSDIYKEHSNQMNNPSYMTWNEYPLLSLMINENANANASVTNGEVCSENECCDVIMKKYLKAIHPQCNDDYLVFVIKFIILFRECFNSFKGKDDHVKEVQTGEASAVNSADKLPELCNSFFCDYLDKKNYVCFQENTDQYELIEIIQHFCYWLFINKYTKSRICLFN